MSELTPAPEPRRRRRADAEQNIAAILGAAARVLGRDPQASMGQVAKAAGTTRQTVYAHFPSREALLTALIDRATGHVLTALEEADLDSLAPAEGLTRLIEISWEAFDAEPFLLQLPNTTAADEDRDRHQPVLEHLERIIRRGRSRGEFDPELPISWMLSATIALGHAAGEEVNTGRMSSGKARDVLARGLTRLFAAPAAHQ